MTTYRYDHKEIEKRWQHEWKKDQSLKAEDFSKKKKSYILTEFPYPSGDGLHVGHIRQYAALDTLVRKRRMQGENVLWPTGWDAFGLPTENYAIKTGVHPREATDRNIANFRRQMQALGLSFDWSREVDTTDPKYYKWTQWIFLQFYKKGLAYQAEIPINWCPKDKIGLANEEVVNGCCERCGTEVTRKRQKQWMLKITVYADRLLKDLDTVSYLEKIKTQQVNWIGRSEGAEVQFRIRSPIKSGTEFTIEVFTTRPDTLFGATYVVMAPEHPLVAKIATPEQKKKVERYVRDAAGKSDLDRTDLAKEKTGVFTGAYAVNPVNDESIPIWVADYVLASYGTGAIMAVPAHDDRDHAFATKYDLPIRHVVMPKVLDQGNPPRDGHPTVERPMVQAIIHDPKADQYLVLHWKEFPWTTFVVGGVEDGEDVTQAALREVKEETGYTDLHVERVLGGAVHAEYFAEHKGENRRAITTAVLLTLRSDQREPVTPEEQAKHDVAWLPISSITEKTMRCSELPLWLDRLQGNEAFTGEGVAINSSSFDGLPTGECKKEITAWIAKHGAGKAAVNYKLRDWVFSRQHYWGEPIPVVHCTEHGVVPVPDDQLPVELPHVENYEPTDTGESPLAVMTDWVNTTCPTCDKPARRETDTMPNWAGSSWYFLRFIDPHNEAAFADPKKLQYWTPVDLYNGGMEHTTVHLLYSRFWHKFLYDQKLVPQPEPYARRHSHGIVLAPDGRKMSKSFGNVVNPDDLVEKYGADSVRMYEMFMGPFEDMIPWSDEGMVGVRRFLDRVYVFAQNSVENSSPSRDAKRALHQTIRKVSEDLEAFKFNTAVSSLMSCLNSFTRAGGVPADLWAVYVKVLAPFAPHLAEELWHALGNEKPVFREGWPEYDAGVAAEEEIEIAVEVNGKVRATLMIAPDLPEIKVRAAAVNVPNVVNHLKGKKPKKTIYVSGRLINFVV